MTQIYVGTSGWHYPHWRSAFYPAKLPPREWLSYYATQLQCEPGYGGGCAWGLLWLRIQ